MVLPYSHKRYLLHSQGASPLGPFGYVRLPRHGQFTPTHSKADNDDEYDVELWGTLEEWDRAAEVLANRHRSANIPVEDIQAEVKRHRAKQAALTPKQLRQRQYARNAHKKKKQKLQSLETETPITTTAQGGLMYQLKIRGTCLMHQYTSLLTCLEDRRFMIDRGYPEGDLIVLEEGANGWVLMDIPQFLKDMQKLLEAKP